MKRAAKLYFQFLVNLKEEEKESFTNYLIDRIGIANINRVKVQYSLFFNSFYVWIELICNRKFFIPILFLWKKKRNLLLNILKGYETKEFLGWINWI